MKESKPDMEKRQYLLTLTKIVIAVAVAGHLLVPTEADAQTALQGTEINPPPKIRNLTKSLQIVQCRLVQSPYASDLVVLTFRNEGSAGLTAFSIVIGPTERDHDFANVEFLFSDMRTEISPGESYEMPVSNSSRLQTDGVLIKAALFSDGTSEGDTKLITELKDERRGQKDQLARGLAILASMGFSESNYPSELAALKAKLTGLEVKKESESVAYNVGLNIARDHLLRDVDELTNGRGATPYLNLFENKPRLESKLERVIRRL